jgi:hypothetical protein
MLDHLGQLEGTTECQVEEAFNEESYNRFLECKLGIKSYSDPSPILVFVESHSYHMKAIADQFIQYHGRQDRPNYAACIDKVIRVVKAELFEVRRQRVLI